MNSREVVQELAATVQAWYGYSRAWSNDQQLARMARDLFAGYTIEELKQALGEWQQLHPGETPKPVELPRLVKRHRPADKPEFCQHTWSVLPDWQQEWERERRSEASDPVDEHARLSVCAHCQTEAWMRLQLVSEQT